jgi:hypothetical protein
MAWKEVLSTKLRAAGQDGSGPVVVLLNVYMPDFSDLVEKELSPTITSIYLCMTGSHMDGSMAQWHPINGSSQIVWSTSRPSFQRGSVGHQFLDSQSTLLSVILSFN